MPGRTSTLLFPALGMDRRVGYQSQPPFSTVLAENVRAVGSDSLRVRGGSRPGMTKAISTETGSGSPVRLLTQVRQRYAADATSWTDEFPGDELDSTLWTDGSATDPVAGLSVLGPPKIDSGFAKAFGPTAIYCAYRSDIGINKAQDYTVSVPITPGYSVSASDYLLFVRMANSSPDISQDGVLAWLSIENSGASTLNLRIAVAGVQTVIKTVSGSVPDSAGVFSVTVSTDTIAVSVYGTEEMSEDVSGYGASAGDRTGFGVYHPASSREPQVDYFRIGYYPSAGEVFVRTRTIASSGGTLYREGDNNDFESVTSDLTLASDRPLYGAEYYGKLYIADHADDVAQAGDGVISGGDTLDSATYADWTTIADADDHVVVLYNSPTAANDGVYAISAIIEDEITLDTSGLTNDTSQPFRITRKPKVYDAQDDTLAAWEATDGTVPPGCSLICLYMNRIVLAGDQYNPHVWYMSRSNDPLDFDYSELDTAAAIGGTSSTFPVIADPITALVPYLNDYLLIGTKSEIWVVRGDPRLGGRMDNLSRAAGIHSARSWCWTPNGALLFMDSDGGLFAIPPGAVSFPEPLSIKRLPNELRSFASGDRVHMAFDTYRNGVFIWIDTATGNAERHWFLDWDGKSFWSDTLDSDHVPTVARDNAELNESTGGVLVGCADGYVRRYDNVAATDDGTAYRSRIVFGPIKTSPPPGHDGILVDIVAVLGEESADVTWRLIPGDTPENAVNGSTTGGLLLTEAGDGLLLESGDSILLEGQSFATGTWVAGRNYTNRPMLRSGAFSIEVEAASGNASHWEIESIEITRVPAGRQRLA